MGSGSGTHRLDLPETEPIASPSDGSTHLRGR
jgi:hypothetical protein